MFYLIEHNRKSKITHIEEHKNYLDAQNICLQKEKYFIANNKPEIEVVIFEANSLDDLKQTHSRYFVRQESENNTAGTLMAVGLVSLAVYLLHQK